MRKINTFIKDLDGVEKVTPEYVEALDDFMFEWVESALPYYHEFKRRGADVFCFENVGTFGNEDAEFYELDGIHYRYKNSDMFGKTLSLNAGVIDKENFYTPLNLRECFFRKYPEYHPSTFNYGKDWHFFSLHFLRYYKKNEKYKIVEERVKEQFRLVADDPEIILDLGFTSYLYSNPIKRATLDRMPCFYY